MTKSHSDSTGRAPAPLDVVVVGAGMFTRDVILPSLYHLQRSGEVGSISLAATSTARLAPLAADEELAEAFPGQEFVAYPGLEDAGRDPRAYLRALDALAPQQLVFVAVPDHLHYQIILDALQRDQHVYSVKPLVQRHEQGRQIGALAAERGLFVGIDYHKRFDRRSLVARRQYGHGDFGEFAYGEARLFEPYFYRHSNFQNWFTCDNSDPFTYVGCHYVDLVYFITGLRPVAVSAAGATGTFPNGNTGYLWAHGRVHWENGAILSVSAGLGYPDAGAGSNAGAHPHHFAHRHPATHVHPRNLSRHRHAGSNADSRDLPAHRYSRRNSQYPHAAAHGHSPALYRLQGHSSARLDFRIHDRNPAQPRLRLAD